MAAVEPALGAAPVATPPAGPAEATLRPPSSDAGFRRTREVQVVVAVLTCDAAQRVAAVTTLGITADPDRGRGQIPARVTDQDQDRAIGVQEETGTAPTRVDYHLLRTISAGTTLT